MGLLAALLLLIAYFALASSRVVGALRKFYDNKLHGGLLIAMLIIPCLLVTLPTARDDLTGFVWGLARMLAYLFVPGLLMLFRPAENKPFDRFDILAILAIWIPIEVNWLPEANALIGEAEIPIPLLTAIVLAFLLFLVIRPLEGLGYTYQYRGIDPGYALIGLAFFALIGIPPGMGMGFIHFDLRAFKPDEWLITLLLIFFFNALPEEMLFRGIIQNLAEKRFGANWWVLVAQAIFFGLTHINNTTSYHTPPNWPYVIMATLAGLGYGWVWRKSGKITASAITHTLVNFMWWTMFKG